MPAIFTTQTLARPPGINITMNFNIPTVFKLNSKRTHPFFFFVVTSLSHSHYLVKQLLPSCVRLDCELQLSVHCCNTHIYLHGIRDGGGAERLINRQEAPQNMTAPSAVTSALTGFGILGSMCAADVQGTIYRCVDTNI